MGQGIIFLIPLTLLIALNSITAQQQCTKTGVARFKRNHALSFPGQELENHVIKEFSTKYQATQCAMECFLAKNCKSFNFDPSNRTCQINDATHKEFPADLKVKNSTTEYHLRDAFGLDESAIGPCGSSPCQNDARCLDTKSSNGDRMYICLCKKGWTGTNCDVEENRIEWADWADWGTCSVSCGHGYQSRFRKCMDAVNGEVSSSKCYGRDVEFQACPYKDCPRWEKWGEWGPCSTFTSCGRGYMIRHRNCSNGGKPGVDRYCKGSDNETTVCEGIACNSMVRLLRDSQFKYGEGRVEMYNDQSNAWMSVCADKWNETAADIVCKQNGFLGANAAITNGIYGKNSDISSQYITTSCRGSEHYLQECEREEVTGCSNTAGVKCRVKGIWNLWTPWSTCSVTCENGTQVRTRKCDYPPPNHGGRKCPGNDTEYKDCSLPMCPRNGTLSAWSDWSNCSNKCGGGLRSRVRQCDNTYGPCLGNTSESQACNVQPCIVDGYWLPWSKWSECSVTCANGTQNRSRECNLPKYGGAMCSGPYDEVRPCYPRECPVDGNWEQWTSWTTCTSTCGYGSQTRNRTCVEPLHGGALCPGPKDETQSCNAFSCPIDGAWKPWSDWGVCTVSCGGGKERRTRECVDPEHGGKTCPGPADEEQSCNTHNCPIDGVFTEWSLWSACSVTCANGTRSRNRTCNGPLYEGKNCTGDWDQVEICVAESCPVDGVWKAWSQWDTCNVTCGGGGQHRYRDCDGPFFKGAPCNGSDTEWQECNMHNCPINGSWTNWNNWTDCTVTCGGGSQDRNRTCLGPFWGGENCTGPESEVRDCSLNPCPVDGYWEIWANWTSCNVSCGGGTRWRTRNCVLPLHGGTPCYGKDLDSKACNTHHCPVDGIWNEWADWNICSLTCGNGSQTRNRTCVGPFFGGHNCSGDAGEERQCNTFNCPVDGVWELWSNWSVCSHSCGRGSQIRNRTCIGPFFGGANCTGPADETQYCNPASCPADGIWNEWEAWGACDVTCGYGTWKRRRTCNGPFDGGKNCTGENEESSRCSLGNCPVDGIFTEWSAWSPCLVSCGGATRSRLRSCIGPFFGGVNCQGNSVQDEDCNSHPCPVDGAWSAWSNWATCNATCGGGYTSRYRYCSIGAHGGSNCTGPKEQFSRCNNHSCPVDGVFLDWGSWSECSHSCGTGLRSRNRTCDGPYFNGTDCQGNRTDIEDCNTHFCPVDGVFDLWMSWSNCTHECGTGSQVRKRECIGPFFNGKECQGSFDESQACNTHPCPVNGVWEAWSTWDSCNTTCGGGTKLRNRTCTGPFFGGSPCNGSYWDSDDCNTHPCPIDGIWNTWSHWGMCNVTCGAGQQMRERNCSGPFFGGAECKGAPHDFRICNDFECPIDGIWATWSDWDTCSTTCGGGNQSRYRECIGPFFGGANCSGSDKDTQECSTHYCPIDGLFDEWSDWYSCSVSCGGGIKWRNRTCIGPYYGGSPCNGSFENSTDCNTHECPIDGVFDTWSDWNTCNVTCGGGMQFRNRSCIGPFYGGAPCDDYYDDNRTCNTQPCPIDGEWNPWMGWEACSVTCAGGKQQRRRICNQALHGGKDCDGPSVEERDCNTHNCPVDGIFGEWTPWSMCNATCGGGFRWRNRTCVGPFFGGRNCSGDYQNYEDCNMHNCPIDGVWKDWTDWGECSVTCGGGIRYRYRYCDGPFYGGHNCTGHDVENRTCSTNLCPIPGDWLEWSSWTTCSVTCNGGTRERYRECNMTSYGNLTDPCLGLGNETAVCHNFTCLPFARHCTELVDWGLVDSTYAEVKITNRMSPPGYKVFCDLDAENGIGVTVINHNKDHQKWTVTGYEGAGSYKIQPQYVMPYNELVKLVDSSANCSQFVEWECKGASIHNPHYPDSWITYWVNRTNDRDLENTGAATYFPGGGEGSGKCACGMTNSCDNATLPCNCDMNDMELRVDRGFITNKAELPLRAFCVGDTGTRNLCITLRLYHSVSRFSYSSWKQKAFRNGRNPQLSDQVLW